MTHSLDEVKDALRSLTGNCNIGLLHPLDKERVVEVIWGLAQKGLLDECNIPKTARDEFGWKPHAVDFLKSTVDVVDVLHPMVASGTIKL
ncbi:MAG: hypothetical protein ABII79_13090 [bacterium]